MKLAVIMALSLSVIAGTAMAGDGYDRTHSAHFVEGGSRTTHSASLAEDGYDNTRSAAFAEDGYDRTRGHRFS
ncbi:heme utilization protein [Pseudomonas endophytica]|uniref:Heme utilization protein n=1 Tax=Pseudomonas endophytica TaxID=1563157 RepID=A0A0Q0XXJ6_9PSED|nr:hypothetical protein [Pseudomonas endophytica]KQB55518.1 heme utilization protein [Pseudomonas endophytica]